MHLTETYMHLTAEILKTHRTKLTDLKEQTDNLMVIGIVKAFITYF